MEYLMFGITASAIYLTAKVIRGQFGKKAFYYYLIAVGAIMMVTLAVITVLR